ncbi:MAG: hypothetical protein ABIK36_16230 [Pseudomonadota bacterium]
MSHKTSDFPENWDPQYKHPTNLGELLERKLKRAVAIEEARDAAHEVEKEKERRLRIPFRRSVSPLQVLIDRVREARSEKRGLFQRIIEYWG